LGPVDLVAQDPAAPAEALAVASLAAVPARTTSGDARHQHLVAGPHVLHAGADFLDRADRFVAEDAAVGHGWDVALEDVQIGAADRHGIHPHDGIGVR
jgi:hypothetical protein